LIVAAQADTYSINYHLSKPGKVSVAVYNADSQIVREILRAVPQDAGRHTLIWDGLDREGKGVPAGKYTWKLLQTPGLSAQFQLIVGANYPVGTDLSSSSGPGTHRSPYTVATDETGIYIAALNTENLETCLLKLSPDGQQRLWSQVLPFDVTGAPVPWEGALSIAVDKGLVYSLGHLNLLMPGWPQRVYVSDGATGQSAGARVFQVTTNNPGATDMDIHDGVLVLAFQAENALRWYDPKTGVLLDTATVPAPAGVAVGSNGTVFVSTSNTVVSLSQANHAPTPVITSGLTKPERLDVDHSNGDLLVFDAETQQVKRFSSTGARLKTYGAAGGRQDGLYEPCDFAGFTDLCADGHGGLFAVEAYAAPRRVAHFANDGAVTREWYGGQQWDSHADFEPGNPGAMWMTSAYSGNHDTSYLMRMLVDWKTNTWRVHSCYKYVSPANPLMHMSANEAGFFRLRRHGGVNYVAIEGWPCIWKVDEKNWKLIPVTSFGAGFQWNDQNGDGLVQDSEKSAYTNSVAPLFCVSHLAEDFDHYFIDGALQVRRQRVASWNAAGAPIYTNAPPEVYAPTPSRLRAGGHADARWGGFLYYDTRRGHLYGAFNPGTHDWCSSADSFMQQWNAQRQLTWGAGEQGRASRFRIDLYTPTDPGQIYWNLRGIAGLAHGCIIGIDVNGGWLPTQTAQTYVWDRDGLFVGGLMDNVDTNGIPFFLYRCGGEFAHSSVHTLPDGDVLFAGNWENDVRVYKVTGWNNWVRRSGTIRVRTPSADETGQGLMVERLNKHTTRWRGTVVPTYGPKYTGFWARLPEPWNTTKYFDNTARRSRANGDRVDCQFRGASIRVVGAKATNCGYANVYLDGALVVTNFDCYASNTVYDVTYFEQSGLTNTDHVVTLEVVGWLGQPRHPAATDACVYLDRFVVDGVSIDDEGLPYTFAVTPTAGTRLWVNNAPVTAPVKLERTHHPLQIDADGSQATLNWSSPLDAPQPIPTSALFPVVVSPPIPASQ